MKTFNQAFSQTKQYYEILKNENKKPFYIRIDNDNYILLFRTYKKILGITIPFFYKVSSYQGFCFTSEKNFIELVLNVKQIIKYPWVLKAQITTHPMVKLPENNFFNKKNYTYILRLNDYKNEDEYLSFVNSKVRNIIKRSIKQEMVIKEILSKDDVEEYIEFVNANRVENNISPIDKHHIRLTWDIAHQHKLVRYFMVYKDDIPLASQGINISMNGFVLVQTSTSKKAYKMKKNANDFMQFSIIKIAIEENMDYIDWGGAQPKSSDAKINAIDKFKAKWGGELIQYPAYFKGY